MVTRDKQAVDVLWEANVCSQRLGWTVSYDLETGKVAQQYDFVHDGHINIARFANYSPHLFASSSFDRTIKLWDMRAPW